MSGQWEIGEDGSPVYLTADGDGVELSEVLDSRTPAALRINAAAALYRVFRDAERLRSLAATFDSHLNRGQTFTGAQVAAMLRDDESGHRIGAPDA